MAVIFKDNSGKVLRQMDGNVSRALEAIGTAAVGLIVTQMETGYAKRIWRKGDLQRDVKYKVDEDAQRVTMGNSLEYGPYVHEGTSRMAGRAYIRDSLLGTRGQARIKAVAEAYLSEGFD